MSDLAKRLAFNRHLPRHLSEVSRLLKREVRREDLLSLGETEAILVRSKATNRAPGWKCSIPFDDKSLPRFRNLIRALGASHPRGVYLWTPLASVCGLHRAVSLSEIDFDFDFDLSPDGIMTILSEDLADKMLLDYSLDEGDRKMLEVEVSGLRWGAVKY